MIALVKNATDIKRFSSFVVLFICRSLVRLDSILICKVICALKNLNRFKSCIVVYVNGTIINFYTLECLRKIYS